MPQSYLNLLYHIIFSTKNRMDWITLDMEDRLHAYLGGAIKSEGGIPFCINGTANHIHILAKLRQDKAISNVIGKIKANSTGWIHSTFPDRDDFYWQSGYAGFSVSKSQLNTVSDYIKKQKTHHRIVTFEDEYKKILKLHDLEFNEEFLFG